MAEEENWYTIGQLAEGYETSPQVILNNFSFIKSEDVVEDFNISDYPWWESLTLYDGHLDAWLSLVGIPVEELDPADVSNWDPDATGGAVNSLAIASEGARSAVELRHPVTIAAAVGKAYVFAQTFANLPAVQRAATAPTVATNVIADLERVAQLSFKT